MAGHACFATGYVLFLAAHWATAVAVGVGVMLLGAVSYTLGEILGGPITTTIAAESAPDALRGRYLSLNQLAVSAAGAVAPAVLSGLLSAGGPCRGCHGVRNAETASLNACGAAGSKGFNERMESALWGRLPVEARSEVDSLVSAGRTVQAIAVMRDRVGPPRPSLHECVDLVSWRLSALRQGGPTHR